MYHFSPFLETFHYVFCKDLLIYRDKFQMLGKVVEIFFLLEYLFHCIETVSGYDEICTGMPFPHFLKKQEYTVRVIKQQDVLELAEIEYKVCAVFVCKFVGKHKDLLNLCV